MKFLTIAISIPVIIVWLLIVMLYIPPVQRFVIDEVCQYLEEESGYDVEIGSFHLAFPLKLKISDFKVSRNDSIYASGKKADVNISLMPLLKGEVEVNYVQLEGIGIDTRELLPTMSVDGEIGFFRVVARNIDFENEIANIRQIHLHSTSLNIALKDTIVEEEEETSEPLEWVVNMRRANIENCSFSIDIPGDTMKAATHIGKINLERARADLGRERYRLQEFSISNTDIAYDQGTRSAGEAPLDHIRVNEINIEARRMAMNSDSTSLNLTRMTFIQPGGIRVTEASASLVSDAEKLNIKSLSLRSKNGSSISCKTSLPWASLDAGGSERLKAELSATVNRNDLHKVLTSEEYAALDRFDENMFSASIKVEGNTGLMKIDRMDVNVPGITSFSANGEARNLLDTERLAADLNIDCHTGNLRELLGYSAEGNDNGEFLAQGNVKYIAGEANADLDIKGAGGNIATTLLYNTNNGTYNAVVDIDRLAVVRIMPDIPLHNLTMRFGLRGEGVDLFDKRTTYDADIKVDSIHYADYRLSDIAINATQANSLSHITVKADDSNIKMMMKAGTELGYDGIKNSTEIDVAKLDFKELGLTDAGLGTEMKLNIDASTNLDEIHSLKFNGKNIRIITEAKTYPPAAISLDLATSPDTSYIKAKNGDLRISGTLASGYNGLFSALDKVGSMYSKARESSRMEYYIHDYEREIPSLTFNFECGENNMLHNIMAMNGIDTDNIKFSITLDTIKGFNMNSGIYGFSSGDVHLDTIRMFTRQEGNKLRYLAGVRSTSINPEQQKETYNAAIYGNIFNDSLTTNLVFRDSKEQLGVKMGFTTLLMPKELNIKFSPEAVLMGNRFRFDKENYLNIGEKMSIDADITLSNDKDAGMHLYTNPDPTSKYNANLELFNVNLKDVTSLIPYAPDIAGILNLDLHYRENSEGMLVSCDAVADSIAYNGTYIGNEIFEAVYFPKNDGTHYIDLIARHEEEEIAHLNGNYTDDATDPGLDGNITLTRFPLEITKAFMKDSGIDISGYLNSDLTADGRFSELKTNGYMQFDSVKADVHQLNATFTLADELVDIKNNRIRFNDFDIYDKTGNPFKISGAIDLTHLSDPTINLRMNAKEYEVVNSPRKKGSMLYGKLFVDLRSFIRGTLNNLNIFGSVSVLGKSNITYVMLNAPIESDKELDGLVEFVNFKDTTAVDTLDTKAIDLGNTKINLTLNIDDAARINADFDENRSSYIMLQGGGLLHLTYTDEAGMNVTGNYTMKDGQLKYSLPIIPLKTFKISDGSKVTWTGDIADPEVNITALERVTSSVTFEDNSMLPVAFDVGVKLSNSLSNMGLSFTMSAPENAIVQEQLNQLDAETMNKYAVTMLITGAYMGSSKGMTVSNALSSFLDAKINNLAGSAMKSVSVNVGINDAQNAETGSTYKNYSFSFSKRFWNDRLTIVIGGEVNSGDHPGSSDGFINNVSLEWKISENSNRYIRIFYDKNYKSILEGEITETGVGYIYKRKLNNLNELLIFRKKKENAGTGMMQRQPGGREQRADSIKVNRNDADAEKPAISKSDGKEKIVEKQETKEKEQ